ncbi:cell division protein ZapA [Flexibacter flexilis DSM 6793]|uniref:Cell division protein ZapA n=1 Tax=Flexibacter flexilis DSM 6793 TaxID=927664 RepID=A0A1I1E9Z3_9BACT|nr:cell division protein ZapA [Flexibacter flexilis]SFB83402.1 cell division protein ZapA [Flexibacter flexilis DSM 6793]
MAVISIKIKIADREYPMKVEASEEEYIRRAAKQLNEAIVEYRERFGISDKLDILAMVAFDALADKIRTDNELTNTYKQLNGALAQLDAQISRELE